MLLTSSSRSLYSLLQILDWPSSSRAISAVVAISTSRTKVVTPGDRCGGLAELSLFNLREALTAMEEDISSCALKFKEILKRAYLDGPRGADVPNEANVQIVTPKRHAMS